MRALRILVVAAVVALCGMAGRPGEAAQLRLVSLPNGGKAILLTGIIAQGDAAAFHELAETLRQAIVITTGPGGDVYTAFEIGSETRARGWSTLVPQSNQCASACSLIWLAGQTRMLAADAQIGFHAMSYLINGRRTETHDADIDLRRWLTDLGYTYDATATIVNTQSSSVRWFDIVELRANGIPTDPYP